MSKEKKKSAAFFPFVTLSQFRLLKMNKSQFKNFKIVHLEQTILWEKEVALAPSFSQF
jgi:hypothetical protein